METIIPRNNPSDESMTQDNVVKKPVYMPTPDNIMGNESGESTTAGYDTPTREVAPQAPATYINIDASSENRSAQFKNPQATQDIPDAARGQYQ